MNNRTKRFLIPLYRLINAVLCIFAAKKISIGDCKSSFRKLGWLTLDLHDAHYVCDIRKDRLPFGDGQVAFINCSHVVEHLHDSEVGHFLAECYRVLCVSGVLRISTPDAALLIDRYLAGDWRYFLACDGMFIFRRVVDGQLAPESLLMHNRLVGWFASYSGRLDTGGGPLVGKDEVDQRVSQMDSLAFGRWCVSLLEPERVCAHVNLYDQGRLRKALVAAGFGKIDVNGFNSSSVQAFNSIDRRHHEKYSMYIDVFR